MIINKLKPFFKHFKEKFFLYVIITALLVLVWFMSILGQINKISKEQEFYFWTTPLNYSELNLKEGSEEYIAYEQKYNQAFGILEYLDKNKKNYGYKAVSNKQEQVDVDDNNHLTVFGNYAEYIVDAFIMPYSCYKSDSKINPSTNKEFASYEQLGKYLFLKSNRVFCNRFISLEHLFPKDHKDYQNYLNFLNKLRSEGRIVSFTKLEVTYNSCTEVTREVGIKINDDYVLSFSNFCTINYDTLLNLLNDIIK